MPREARFIGSCIVRIAQLSVLVALQPLPLHYPANREPLGFACKVVRGLVKMQIVDIRG
jgi:hypothetical protein